MHEKSTALIIEILKSRSQTVATAESCTGGLVAHYLTNISGASSVFRQGLITYTNASKMELLDLPGKILEKYGAVSQEVATLMAEGVRKKSGTSFGLATTGIAGPNGGSEDTPVGTLYLAIAEEGKETLIWKEYFPNEERLNFKEKAAEAILKRLSVILTHRSSNNLSNN